MREAAETATSLAETLKTAISARNKAADDAQVATGQTVEMVKAAQAMEQQAAEAIEVAAAAQEQLVAEPLLLF